MILVSFLGYSAESFFLHMKKYSACLLFLALSSSLLAQRQSDFAPCGGLESEADHAQLATNRISSRTVFQKDKKTGTETFQYKQFFNESGCIIKTLFPEQNSVGGKYTSNEYVYNPNGVRIGFKKTEYDKDSLPVVFQEEWMLTDAKGRWTEAHYRYYATSTQTNYGRIDREDLYYKYNDENKTQVITHHLLFKSDTVTTLVYYLPEKGEATRTDQITSGPHGTKSIETRDASRLRMAYRETDAAGKTTVNEVYEYTGNTGNINGSWELKVYSILAGKKELVRRMTYDNGIYTESTYNANKEITSKTWGEQQPYGTPPPDNDPLFTADPAPCKPMKKETTGAGGKRIVTTWEECGSGKTAEKRNRVTTTYQKNGLKESEDVAANVTTTVYRYTTR